MEDNVGIDDSEFGSVTSSQELLMEDNVGFDDSEFGSVTSSQKSLLKHVRFADPQGLLTKSTGGVLEMDADSTEVLGNLDSPPVVATPVLSFTTPASLDSVNDDVFRTPPEVASLSATADSEPKVVSEMKTASIEGMKSPTPPASASSSLVVENVRATETLKSISEVAPLSSTPSVPAKNVRIPGKLPGSASSSSKTIGRSKGITKKPISKSSSPAGKNIVVSKMVLPSSKTAKSVRVPATNPGSSSTRGFPGIKISETAWPGGDVARKPRIPFREIIKAILRNSGQLNENEAHGNLSCVDTLKKMGVRFP